MTPGYLILYKTWDNGDYQQLVFTKLDKSNMDEIMNEVRAIEKSENCKCLLLNDFVQFIRKHTKTA